MPSAVAQCNSGVQKPSTRRTTIKTKASYHIVRTAVASVAFACALLASGARSAAGEADDKLSKPMAEIPPPSSSMHVFFQNEFSDHYITPRGLNVEDKGLVWQPLLILLVDLYSANSGFLTDVTLAPGVWNSIHTHRDGPQNHNWNEIDPFIGLDLKLFKDFEFDSTYTAFVSQNGSFPTSTNLDFKLTYHDHFIKNFSINPYVEYFYELTNKATVVINPATSQRGYYFQFGVDPTYTIPTEWPITLDVPTYFSVVSDNFYQRLNGSGGGSGVGVFSSEFKVAMPIKCIPKSYGSWTAYTGFQYYYLNNPGVLDGNTVLGTESGRNHNLYQFHAGVQLFF